MRITFLEGGRVGALALSAAIHHSLQAVEDGSGSNAKATNGAKRELLEIGRFVNQLPVSECEVLYGRAGYLHAIEFVRSEIEDKDFGKELVQLIVRDIIREGIKVANESHCFGYGMVRRIWERYTVWLVFYSRCCAFMMR